MNIHGNKRSTSRGNELQQNLLKQGLMDPHLGWHCMCSPTCVHSSFLYDVIVVTLTVQAQFVDVCSSPCNSTAGGSTSGASTSGTSPAVTLIDDFYSDRRVDHLMRSCQLEGGWEAARGPRLSGSSDGTASMTPEVSAAADAAAAAVAAAVAGLSSGSRHSMHSTSELDDAFRGSDDPLYLEPEPQQPVVPQPSRRCRHSTASSGQLPMPLNQHLYAPIPPRSDADSDAPSMASSSSCDMAPLLQLPAAFGEEDGPPPEYLAPDSASLYANGLGAAEDLLPPVAPAGGLGGYSLGAFPEPTDLPRPLEFNPGFPYLHPSSAVPDALPTAAAAAQWQRYPSAMRASRTTADGGWYTTAAGGVGAATPAVFEQYIAASAPLPSDYDGFDSGAAMPLAASPLLHASRPVVADGAARPPPTWRLAFRGLSCMCVLHGRGGSSPCGGAQVRGRVQMSGVVSAHLLPAPFRPSYPLIVSVDSVSKTAYFCVIICILVL